MAADAKKDAKDSVDADAKAAAAKAKAASKKGKKGFSPSEQLLIILFVMVGLAVTFYVLTIVYPVKENKYAKDVRTILRPIVGNNPELEKYLSKAAEAITSEEEARIFLEKAIQKQEEAEKARVAMEKKRDDALEHLVSLMTQRQEEAAANPEGISEDGGLQLSEEDMATLKEYMEERKREKGEL